MGFSPEVLALWSVRCRSSCLVRNRPRSISSHTRYSLFLSATVNTASLAGLQAQKRPRGRLSSLVRQEHEVSAAAAMITSPYQIKLVASMAWSLFVLAVVFGFSGRLWLYGSGACTRLLIYSDVYWPGNTYSWRNNQQLDTGGRLGDPCLTRESVTAVE